MDEVFYTPDNEPYLGLPALLHFDEALISAFRMARTLAPLTRGSALSHLEVAVIDLVPTSISIAASIRELIRQAYLPAAKILLRPLIERTAVVDFLVNDPRGIELWISDWSKCPKLRDLMMRMSGQNGWDAEVVDELVKDYNAVVHADPGGSRAFIWSDASGRAIYSPGRAVGAEAMAQDISLAGWMAVTFLESNAKRAFRDRVVAAANEQ